MDKVELEKLIQFLAPFFAALVIFLYCLGAIIKEDITKKNRNGNIIRSRWITTDAIAPIQFITSIVISITTMFILTLGERFGIRVVSVLGIGTFMGVSAAFASNGSYDVYHGLKKWLQRIYDMLKSFVDTEKEN
jgi:hypothetical protein